MPDPNVRKQLESEWQGLLARLPGEMVTSPGWFLERFRYAQAGALRPTVLFAELEEVLAGWADLRASGRLEEFSDRYVNAGWTLKDLLAHMASWAGEFRREVEIVVEGGAFDYAIPFAMSVAGPNQWNQVEVEKRRAQSLEALLDEFERETRGLQDMVLDLPPETLAAETEFPLAPTGDPSKLWRSATARMVSAKCQHDLYHLGQINRWLAGQS